MAAWIDDLLAWLGARSGEEPRRVFTRRVVISGPAQAWLDARPGAERLGFAELLMRLDADPVAHSEPVLTPGVPPGMRFAGFGEGVGGVGGGGHRVLLVWDPARDMIHIVMFV